MQKSLNAFLKKSLKMFFTANHTRSELGKTILI